MAILSVLVVCNCRAEDSKTANSLLQAYASNPTAFEFFKLVIYDNSPEIQSISADIPFEYEYVHDPSNAGLAGAYNYALDRAVAGSYRWLLLFDDDTSTAEDFVSKLLKISSDIDNDNSIAAIVPKVFYNNRFFSPSKVYFGDVHRPIDVSHTGICNFQVTAVNSGVLLRTSFMQQIGGFNRTFWLDCLDSWLFNTIHSSGQKVYVTDLIIEHELSILDYDKFMTEDKYRNTLKYETIFMKSFKTKLEYYFYLIRLLKRTLTLLVTVKNKKYSLITFKHLIRLIFSSGKYKEAISKERPVLK